MWSMHLHEKANVSLQSLQATWPNKGMPEQPRHVVVQLNSQQLVSVLFRICVSVFIRDGL